MDIDDKINLVKKVGEEILTLDELKSLFERKTHPVAYDGFEPSGIAHLPMIYRAININDMLKAGVKFKVFLADWHAWLNNKMGGDLEKIRLMGKYFIEVWKAAGVDTSKVEIVWANDLLDGDYIEKILKVAKNTTIARMIRCTTIMGRTEKETQNVGQLMYPAMQAADIFKLGVDICQLGMDQRKVNILAREIGEKIGYWKPVAVHHHMLLGLQGPAKIDEGVYDDNKKLNEVIASKMSKSKPDTCIYVHDEESEIIRKINKAYCPEKIIEGNPLMDYLKHIIMREGRGLLIERPEKFGGNVEFSNYFELERTYVEGRVHPLDLKKAVAREINLLIKPVREHFVNNKAAAKLYSLALEQKITR